MSWLYELEDVLLPSVYLRQSLTNSQRVGLVGGRVKEALRIARQMTPRRKVLPYYWYKYQDQRDTYLNKVSPFRFENILGDQKIRHLIASLWLVLKMNLSSQVDLEATLRKISELGADGLIIWGSSNDINTKEKCLQFREYLTNDLGPIVSRVRQNALSLTHYESEPTSKGVEVVVDQVWRSVKAVMFSRGRTKYVFKGKTNGSSRTDAYVRDFHMRCARRSCLTFDGERYWTQRVSLKPKTTRQDVASKRRAKQYWATIQINFLRNCIFSFFYNLETKGNVLNSSPPRLSIFDRFTAENDWSSSSRSPLGPRNRPCRSRDEPAAKPARQIGARSERTLALAYDKFYWFEV